MDIQRELTYLNGLSAKYGRYFKQYFGFSLREIANKIGIEEHHFCMCVKGRRALPEKYHAKFAQVFAEMRIRERTENFTPSVSQLETRALRKKILDTENRVVYHNTTMQSKNLNRILASGTAHLFHSYHSVTSREYIRGQFRATRNNVNQAPTAFVFFSNAVFVFSSIASCFIQHNGTHCHSLAVGFLL